MPGLDLANILVAFQTAYVKSLCILTAVLLGPWVGVQIMFYSNHPPDDEDTIKKFLILCMTILNCSVYVVTLLLLAVPDRQCMLIIWLLICMVCILGHWAIYFISFQYFKGKLEELWLPLAIVTILYMALYALPVFYIYFVNWIAEKKPSSHSAERRSFRARSDIIPTDSRGGGGFAEIMQLPKWNIRSNNSYSSYDAKYDDLNKWKYSKGESNP